MEKGYVQIYTGDGKGKTTAALGLALRATGAGLKVYFGQFMKGQDYSELRSIRNLQGVTLEQYGETGWVRKGRLTEEQLSQARIGLEKAKNALVSETYDIVILDELNMALWFGLVPLEEVLALIDLKPQKTELVFTGRRAHKAVIDRADLVTEMLEVKHYYTKEVPARRGIEN